MKKFIFGLICACTFSCSLGLLACNCNGGEGGKTELTRELPQQVVCGSEIYFKEYMPVDFNAEYELTVSYFDCEKMVQVSAEEVESLMFRFENVSKYDFTLNKVGAEAISFSIDSVPVQPKLAETVDWQTTKGETVLLEDIVFWCNVTLEDEGAQIDPTYKLEFVDVEVRSVSVDGSKTTEDLTGKDSYTFNEFAEYVFTIKASNISGEYTTNVTVTTMKLDTHTSDVYGYVFDEENKVEFEIAYFSTFVLPADGEILKVRVGNTKYDAVYNQTRGMFTIVNFEQELATGENERLYIADKNGTAYSLNIVKPNLILTEANFKALETVKDGVVVLAEDIDMEKVSNYGDTRTAGEWEEYIFKGIFDGRGYTIRNFKTAKQSNAGSLLWSVDGATVKNVIFENATVLGNNALVAGRTRNYSKFINIAVEVSQLTTNKSSAFTGPGDYGSYYENCIIFVKATPSTSNAYSGFVNGLYCRTAEFKNAYLVSDLELPVAPSGYSGIEPAIAGDYVEWKVAQAESKFAEEYDWGTALLNQAATTFFSGPAQVNVTAANIDELQSATDGHYTLIENIDLEGKTWAPTTTFTGVLNGNGFKISNLSGALFNAVDNAKISNLILDNVVMTQKGVVASTNLTKDVELNNVIVKVKSYSQTRTSLLGYQTNGTVTLKNVVVEMPTSTSEYKGLLTCNAGWKAILEDVYFIAGTGTLHSTRSDNSTTYVPSYYKADGTTTAVENTDYFIGDKIADFEGSFASLDATFKTMIDNYYFPKIQLSSANITDLQTATNGYYVLTEDVDLSGITWSPTATFAGTLDGNGYTISNLSGNLFHTIDNATICNVILDGVKQGAKGVICSQNLTKDVVLENVIIRVSSYLSGATRTALLGYQTSGTATLKNVVVEMPTSTSEYKGLLTCNAGWKAILEDVYFIAGTGTLHSTRSDNSTTYVPSYYKADGETAAVENTDYYIYASVTAFEGAASSLTGLDAEFKALINKSFNDMLTEGEA